MNQHASSSELCDRTDHHGGLMMASDGIFVEANGTRAGTRCRAGYIKRTQRYGGSQLADRRSYASWARCRVKAHALAALFFLLTATALAEDSQFFFDPTGNLFAETAEVGGPPQIIGQPQMQVVIPGESASFSVGVADTRGVTYQWFFVASAVPGATADSLLITNVSTNNQGAYWVVVSNSVSSTASTLANLYIDSRGCGMPDSWQLQYFGNTNQLADGDYDGDGVSNLQEFLDGTNPTNAASALYRITVVNDGGVVLISPDQPAYTNGQNVTLTATSTNSDPFHAWTGDVVSRSSSISVTMASNMTLFAHFSPITLIWTNAANIVSGDWNVASNWTPNLVPGSNESVVVSGGANIIENSNVDLVDLTLGYANNGSVLTGSGRITISGNAVWNAGTMSGTGATIVKPGATLIIANVPGQVLNNRTLENAGSVAWAGGNFSLGGGVITNDAGAQFQFFGTAATISGGGGSRFDNVGTLILASNAVTTFAGVAFNDYGTVDFPSGTLSMSGGAILASSLSVPAGSSILFPGGAVTSTSNSSLTGPGTLIMNGAIATLAGTVNVSGSNIFGPAGGVDFTGTYICTNNTLQILGGSASFDGPGVVAPMFLSVNGTLGGSQNVTALSAMTWTGGAMTGTGRTIIPPGITLSINNPSFISMTSRTLDNAGTVIWTGAASMSVNGAIITNEPGALFQIQGPQSISGAGGVPRFDNAGTLRIMGGGTTSIPGAPLNNFNFVDIQGGTLALTGGGMNSGTITVPAGTAVNLGGTFTSTSGSSMSGAGQLIVSSGTSTLAGTVNLSSSNIIGPAGSVDFTGNYICTNNSILISGGSASFDGTGVVSPAFLNLLSGNLGGAQNVTIGSAMTWLGGNMTGTGRTVIPTGATLSISNASFISMTSRTLDNAGTTIWNGAANMNMNAAVITNEPGALFQIQGPQSIGGAGGLPRIDNAGTLRITGSGTTSLPGAQVNNFNLVDIQGGTLALTGGGSHRGTITVPAGTAVNLGGTFTSTSGSSITGAGQFIVSGGTATLAGTVNVTGSNIFSPSGSVDFTGNYICTNNSMLISGGSASFDGTGVVSPALLSLNANGTLGGAQNVTIGSAMSWLGGNMIGTGRTIIPLGATLTTSNASPVTMTSRTLDNGGTVLWTGAASVSMNGAVITNRAGGMFNVQNSINWGFSGGSPRFDNAGTFRKSLNTGTMTLSGVPLTNYGTVDIQTGTLAATSGFASASNAVLNCGIAGTIPGTNYGRVQVTGAVTLNGSLSVNLAGSYTPATNDSFTLVTAGTRNGTFSKFIYPSNQVSMVLSNTAASVIATITNIIASAGQPVLYLSKLSTNSGLLYWSTNFPGYFLEYNTSPGTTNWAASGLTPGISGTNFVITNLFSSPQKYYRLSSVPAIYTPPPPPLNIQTVSPGVIRLLWPLDDDRPFSLQSTTSLLATNWKVVASSPGTSGTNKVVTNSVMGSSQFFRLSNH